VFWPRLAWEILHKHAVLADMIVRLVLMKMAIARDPAAPSYMDEALSPVRDDEDETLDLPYQDHGCTRRSGPCQEHRRPDRAAHGQLRDHRTQIAAEAHPQQKHER
jgi:hypothetical protein